MTPEEIQIYNTLKQMNEFAYITPDRKTLYAIAGEGMMKIEHDFAGMSTEEINAYIQEILS